MTHRFCHSGRMHREPFEEPWYEQTLASPAQVRGGNVTPTTTRSTSPLRAGGNAVDLQVFGPSHFAHRHWQVHSGIAQWRRRQRAISELDSYAEAD